MKLLLDECVTRHLKRDLAGHEVHTVEDAGLQGLENGDLLKAASGSYEVLITVDQNLPYQQNIAGLNIAILILAAKRNSYVLSVENCQKRKWIAARSIIVRSSCRTYRND